MYYTIPYSRMLISIRVVSLQYEKNLIQNHHLAVVILNAKYEAIHITGLTDKSSLFATVLQSAVSSSNVQIY